MRYAPFVALIVVAILSLTGCGRSDVSVPGSGATRRALALSAIQQGGNVDLAWSCGKELAGQPGLGREVHDGWWNAVDGTLAWDPVARKLEGMELTIDAASFQADTPVLARTLVDQGWFDVEHFPRATFKVQGAAPRGSETDTSLMEELGVSPMEGWTHLLRGVFTLNGIQKEIQVPAKIEYRQDGLRLSACLGVRRSEFKVASRKAAPSLASAIFKVDEVVKVSILVDSVPGMAQLAAQVQAQQAEIRNLRKTVEDEARAAQARHSALAVQVADAEKTVEFLRQVNIRLLAGEKLPAKFEDVLVYPAAEWDYSIPNAKGEVNKRHFSYPGRRAPFTMVLVPGDPAKGVAPFYIGETEVTWDLFRDWSCWYDAPAFECQKEYEAGFRPSNQDSYGDMSHTGGQYDGYPALGMTRLTAEKFCDFLSKRTGRKYRLPTEAEWERAHALGGGDPATDEEKKAAVWCKENSPDYLRENFDQNLGIYDCIPGKVSTKKPNKLGLYDMLGNVSEWVKTPGGPDVDGKNTFVRGGDFLTPAAQISGARREESDNRRNVEDSWNATYPNDPPSKWWYMNHYQVGFRLVSEPVNLPPAK